MRKETSYVSSSGHTPATNSDHTLAGSCYSWDEDIKEMERGHSILSCLFGVTVVHEGDLTEGVVMGDQGLTHGISWTVGHRGAKNGYPVPFMT